MTALWKNGNKIEAVFLIDQGEVELVGNLGGVPASLNGAPPASTQKPFGSGALLADIDGLRDERPHDTTAKVLADGRAFRVEGPDFSKFLADNPGVLLFLMGAHFAE